MAHPEDTLSPREQRQAHSHAARAAHAKARRLCTIEYQAGKASQIEKDTEGIQELVVASSSNVPAIGAFGAEQAVLPSPVNLLSPNGRDPFDSFARPLKPFEHFLLDHCKCLHNFP